MPGSAATGTALRGLYVLLFLFVGGHGNYFGIWLRDAHWSETAIGWQGGLHLACLAVFPLLWGHLTDKGGHPVSTLRFITVGSAVAFIPFVVTTAVAPLLIATLAFAAFNTGMVTSTDSFTLAHIERAGGDYGRIRIFGSMGFILGGFVMGGVVDLTSRRAIPWVLLVILAITAALVARLSSAQHRADRRDPLGVALRRLWADPRLRRFYAITFANRATSQGLYIFLPLHLQDLGVSDVVVPVYWTIGVASEILLMRTAQRLFGRWSAPRVLVLCFAISALQYLGTALVADPLWLAPIMLLHGFSFGIWYYASVTWLARLVPAYDRGRAQGVFQSVGFGLGGTLSAIAAGYLYAAGAGPLLFGVAASATVAVTIGAWRLLVVPRLDEPAGG
jgi:PPP family 3-phenylpropionic acid transporter